MPLDQAAGEKPGGRLREARRPSRAAPRPRRPAPLRALRRAVQLLEGGLHLRVRRTRDDARDHRAEDSADARRPTVRIRLRLRRAEVLPPRAPAREVGRVLHLPRVDVGSHLRALAPVGLDRRDELVQRRDDLVAWVARANGGTCARAGRHGDGNGHGGEQDGDQLHGAPFRESSIEARSPAEVDPVFAAPPRPTCAGAAYCGMSPRRRAPEDRHGRRSRADLRAECPQRDSNPCFSLERAATWTASRWGPGRARIPPRRENREGPPDRISRDGTTAAVPIESFDSDDSGPSGVDRTRVIQRSLVAFLAGGRRPRYAVARSRCLRECESLERTRLTGASSGSFARARFLSRPSPSADAVIALIGVLALVVSPGDRDEPLP